MSNNLNSKILKATKWSAITEFAAKLIAPISTMILARLLMPQAFGILVTAQMIISFAEIFTDAGFQKYLIQHEFATDEEKDQNTTVAFWSNFIMSITIWVFLIVFSDYIADLVGCHGYGIMISISGSCIPLEAFSSIQIALFKRNLDFKTLFFVRIIGILIPLIVTIPIAFATKSYWSLIVGMIFLNLTNAIILTWQSKWKPKCYYCIKQFKEMFSFSMWSMFEAVSIWLTSYIDIFIVGTMLSQYYLGIYRTSMTTVGQITSIITASTTPVLFSSLSRLQDNKDEFDDLFYKFQKFVALLVLPIGVGIYLFSDIITEILLGSHWMEASSFIGLWGLTSSVTIVFAHYCSEVYRAKGKPKLSVIAQLLHVVVLGPAVLIAVKYGFDILCDTRSLIRFESIFVQLIIMKFVIKLSIIKMFTNTLPSIIAACGMFLILLLPNISNILGIILYIIISIIVYFVILFIFPKERYICINLLKKINFKTRTL